MDITQERESILFWAEMCYSTTGGGKVLPLGHIQPQMLRMVFYQWALLDQPFLCNGELPGLICISRQQSPDFWQACCGLSFA